MLSDVRVLDLNGGHVEGSLVPADEVEHGGDERLQVEARLVDEGLQVRQPSGFREVAGPEEVDLQDVVVAALAGELGHELVVHLGIDEALELDLDDGLLLELREPSL